MEGYLLDTNIVSYLADARHQLHAHVEASHQGLADGTPVFVSAITHGEVEYGITAFPGMALEKQNAIRAILDQFPTLAVSSGVRQVYADIRTRLFERCVKKGKKVRRPEQLTDPATSLVLQVQENDIWITALAVEHRLTLATHDRRMKPLWEATEGQLKVVDWADLSFVWKSSN